MVGCLEKAILLISFVDAHCHLVDPYFDSSSLEKIIRDSKNVGVNTIINCASFPNTFEQCLQSSKYKEIEVTLGLQPSLAGEIRDANIIREILDYHPLSKSVRAIGEVGLDYHWFKEASDREVQEVLFIDCIKLANEFNLPLVIHSRKAESRCLEILQKYAEVKVLLHSFEGKLVDVKLANDLGYMITIPTNVVIRKSRRKVAKRAGLDNIMIETDSPFCPPAEDIRPNTPVTIPIAAEKLATIFEVTIEEVAKITSSNALKFHRL